MQHYEHLRPTITAFFKERGIDIDLEPSGSRGPDVVGRNAPLIGEVKHETELRRDLGSAYWGNWNSTKQRFGGKTLEYRLTDHLPDDVECLSGEAKGWIAVIYGQLRYMVHDRDRRKGWLVYENPARFETSLLEACGYLSRHGLAEAPNPEHRSNVGFLCITFLNRPHTSHPDKAS